MKAYLKLFGLALGLASLMMSMTIFLNLSMNPSYTMIPDNPLLINQIEVITSFIGIATLSFMFAEEALKFRRHNGKED